MDNKLYKAVTEDYIWIRHTKVRPRSLGTVQIQVHKTLSKSQSSFSMDLAQLDKVKA